MAVRAALGAVGLVVGVTGIALEQRWLVWVAVGLLGTAVIIRLIERRRRRAAAP